MNRESIDREAELESRAISRHREMNCIDVRTRGKISYRQQRQSNKEIVERKLFGG